VGKKVRELERELGLQIVDTRQVIMRGLEWPIHEVR
jgi:hypothetical protein